MGSIGVGCTLDKEVEVSVKPSSKTSIFFNKKPISFPTVEYALSSLINKPPTVEIKSSLPLGYGFGISSAATLASLFAINRLYTLKKGRQELVNLAHIAEIRNHTGLGSVATQSTGGFLIKTTPGIHVTHAVQLPFIGQKLYAIIIDKLETPMILKDKNRLIKINQAADKAMYQMKRKKYFSLEDMIDLAFHFTREAHLLTNNQVISLIDIIRTAGGHATMAILGQVVITTTKPKFAFNFPVEELIITNKTVHYAY